MENYKELLICALNKNINKVEQHRTNYHSLKTDEGTIYLELRRETEIKERWFLPDKEVFDIMKPLISFNGEQFELTNDEYTQLIEDYKKSVENRKIEFLKTLCNEQ